MFPFTVFYSVYICTQVFKAIAHVACKITVMEMDFAKCKKKKNSVLCHLCCVLKLKNNFCSVEGSNTLLLNY